MAVIRLTSLEGWPSNSPGVKDSSSILIISVRWQPGKGANRYCFLEREIALRNRRKTGTVFFSGLFFFGYFLLEEQKKVTIK